MPLSTGAPIRSLQWSIGLAAGVVAMSAAHLAYRFAEGAQHYSQFTVGAIAWRTSAKTADYVLLAVLAVTAIVAWLVLRLTSMRIEARSGPSNADVFTSMLGFCTLPMVAWLGANFAGPGAPFSFVHLAACAVLIATLIAVSLDFTARRTADAVSAWLPVSLVIVLLGALFPWAIVFALNRLRIAAGASPVWWNPPLLWLSAFGALVAAAVAIGLARRSGMAHARLVVAALQLPLPWAFFIILPLPWVDGQTIAGTYPVALLPIVALAFVAIGYIDLTWRYFNRASGQAWGSALSPVCLAAVVLVFRLGIPATAGLPSDDYHFGELLLPWWSWASEGLLPFRDYVPARGLVNYFDGACADLLGDGSASFVAMCQPLVTGSWFVLAITATSALVGALAAAGMFAFVPLLDRLTDIDLAMTTLLMVGWQMFDKAPGVPWLIGWGVASLAAFLFAPGQALLLIAATTPLALYQAARAVMNRPARLRSIALWTLGIAAALLFLTPVGAMLLGAWRYVFEHATIASAAHGVEWTLSLNSRPDANYWMWEAARSSFIAVPVLATAVLGNALIARNWPQVRQIAIVAVPVIILGFLYIPRAAGRIGPGEPSRLALASVWMFAALLPVVLHAAWSARKWPAILTITTFVVASVSAMYSFLDLRVFGQRAVPTATVPVTLVDGKHFGLPPLGLAVVQPDHLARLRRLRSILDTLLDPSETFLDMTNRNAHYFYFERRPPVESGALYNLPNDAQQLRAVRGLESNPISVVLASADSVLHDGGPLGLRVHALYRYYVQRFSPVSIDGFIFLMQSDRFSRLERLDGSDIVTNDPALLLEQAFGLPALHGIPASWGRSWDTLQASAKYVSTLQNTTPGFWDLIATPLAGRSAGLLVLTLDCPAESTPPVEMSVLWSGDAGQGSISFTAEPTIVLPLDASPRWLLARQITGIQLQSSDATRCHAGSVKRAELWQRNVASVTDDE